MSKSVILLMAAGVGALFAYLASKKPPPANPPPAAGSANSTDAGRAGFAIQPDFGIQDAGAQW